MWEKLRQLQVEDNDLQDSWTGNECLDMSSVLECDHVAKYLRSDYQTLHLV